MVHDFFCQNKTRRWQDVHRVFHEAMLTSGTDPKIARLMYLAVEKFGPRWEEAKTRPECLGVDKKVDFKKCTENNSTEPSQTIWPVENRAMLEAFLQEIEGTLEKSDSNKLRSAIEQQYPLR